MAKRIGNCPSPDVAWALVHHHLGNDLLAISMLCERREGLVREELDKIEDRIGRNHMELAGALYILSRKMNRLHFCDDALHILMLANMVSDEDITDPEVRDKIHELHKKFDSGVAKLEETVDNLNAAKQQ